MSGTVELLWKSTGGGVHAADPEDRCNLITASTDHMGELIASRISNRSAGTATDSFISLSARNDIANGPRSLGDRLSATSSAPSHVDGKGLVAHTSRSALELEGC